MLPGCLHIGAARQQVEMHVNSIDDARGLIFAHCVLQYDQIARRGNGKVGFGGNNQRKLLQTGRTFISALEPLGITSPRLPACPAG